MRKELAGTAILLAIAVSGCSSDSIDGSVKTVVDACQELTTSDEATAIVTGNIDDSYNQLDYDPSPGEDMALVLYDSDANYVVLCKFEDITQEEIDIAEDGGRQTISGTVDVKSVNNDSVTLIDCTFS